MVSQKPKYCKSFERNGHWRKLSMIMVWECYCYASPKPELFYIFFVYINFLFISQLIWVCLGWNFHTWFSIQKLMYNWSFFFVVLHKPTLLPSTFNSSMFYSSPSVDVARWYGPRVQTVDAGALPMVHQASQQNPRGYRSQSQTTGTVWIH